jgi:hypothetical protein
MVAATSGAQYTAAPRKADEPRMWSKWLCVNTIPLTAPPAISATSALTAVASVNVVPVSISSVPVAPCTRPIVTSRNGRRQR